MHPHPLFEEAQKINRRHFLGKAAKGIGTIALASLLNPVSGLRGQAESRWRGVINPPHFAPKVRRVIHLYMAGGPSHIDLFDPKPALARLNGEAMPESYTAGQPIAQLQGKALKCMAPQYSFNQYGESGMEMAEVLPHMGTVADEMCLIRSMMTEQINHDPAHTFMNTGSIIPGRPSMGAWTLYALGSESENLPGFVVLTSEGGGQAQPISSRQWSAGFLPGRFQGIKFDSVGDPVSYVGSPPGVSHQCQSEVVKYVKTLNQQFNEVVDDPDLATRIAQYELAARMQMSVPELADLSKEPRHILEMYGTEGADGSFASNCLMARRLAERGVRFIQVYHRGWDHHGNIKAGLATTAKHVDKATAALITDLKQRGMLDDTLVIWGGEFGRTPMAQGSGRDHHIKGFSILMCGGGIQKGLTYGSTDELGYNAVENPVTVHDFHATLLHLLGINHKRLTFRYQGRDFRLTDVAGVPVAGILS